MNLDIVRKSTALQDGLIFLVFAILFLWFLRLLFPGFRNVTSFFFSMLIRQPIQKFRKKIAIKYGHSITGTITSFSEKRNENNSDWVDFSISVEYPFFGKKKTASETMSIHATHLAYANRGQFGDGTKVNITLSDIRSKLQPNEKVDVWEIRFLPYFKHVRYHEIVHIIVPE